MSNTGHGSELGGLVTEIGGPKTDADGNLVNSITGQTHTKNAHGTLGENYANGSDLIDDALAKNHTHRIGVIVFGDTEPHTVQQGLEPPTIYMELENARLQYVSGPRTSEPAQTGPGSTTEPAVGGSWSTMLPVIPESKQAQFYTTGVGAGGVISLDLPAGKGRVRGVERAGTTVTTRHAVMTWIGPDGERHLLMDADTGTSLDGIYMTLNTGRYEIVITAPGYDGAFGPCDMSITVDYDK